MYFNHQKLSCKETALQLLSRRDYGEQELHRKLAGKGFSENEIGEVLAYCHDLGYIDDIKFAQSQIRQHISKGQGEIRIRQELKQKSVSETDIDMAFQDFDTDWYELARISAMKKYRVLETVEPKEYARRVRFLQYRGFDFEQIQYALTPDSDE
ncbi:recombination regulator RecX [Vibrio salinus]|uniref:recombination regulator RecX n=1 Tax=Vibrio salinus TaxID=2899784 RepID=UPI001E370AEB|nr:recombination regulator RecX [Vibrio salinus]MCE0494209.1 recombination regulator RecX [Vibrio salinus]